MAAIVGAEGMRRWWLVPAVLVGIAGMGCSEAPEPVRGTEAPAQLDVVREAPAPAARPVRPVPPEAPHDVYDPSDGRPHPPMDLVTGERIRRELLRRGR